MEPLFKQLRDLSKKLNDVQGTMRWLIGAGLIAVLLIGAFYGYNNFGPDKQYQYVFTNLSPEDAAEAQASLKAAGIPFRLEAAGAALAVPPSKVYDARILLAQAGIPKVGSGVGFEIFNNGDIGVSEFTQKVNYRRALEGELARTIGRFAQVRSARVHLTLPEKGLYREEDHKAMAGVVVSLQAGMFLGEKQVAGIRHLVASAVPNLDPDDVTLVDGRGAVLEGKTKANAWTDIIKDQQSADHEVEQRIVSLLEPWVGQGAVVARVLSTWDSAEVNTNSEVVDPEATVLKNERTVNQNQQQNSATPLPSVVGAAANQPVAPSTLPTTNGQAGNSNVANTQEAVRNWEVSKTITNTVSRQPRLLKRSVAILVDGVGGKSRTEAEVARLGDLAKRAAGFEASRGDQFEITSEVFARSTDVPPPEVVVPKTPKWMYAAGGGVAFLLIVGLFLLLRGGKPKVVETQPVLVPGSRVSQIEAATAAASQAALADLQKQSGATLGLADPEQTLRERARELTRTDPLKAAHLLRAWISDDSDNPSTGSGRAAMEKQNG